MIALLNVYSDRLTQTLNLIYSGLHYSLSDAFIGVINTSTRDLKNLNLRRHLEFLLFYVFYYILFLLLISEIKKVKFHVINNIEILPWTGQGSTLVFRATDFCPRSCCV